MRKLILILSCTTLALAASAAWLSFELASARRQPPPANRPAELTTTAAAGVTAPPVPAAGESGKPPPSAKLPGKDERTQQRASMISNLREQLENPEKRAARERGTRDAQRRMLKSVAEHLNLNEEEFNGLVELFVAQDIHVMEAAYQCALNPACELKTAFERQRELNRTELVEYLGEERARRYDNYLDNTFDRRSVSKLRGSLPDSLRLSDAQAEKLIDVLGEERRTIIEEGKQRGVSWQNLTSDYGTLFVDSKSQSIEQVVVEAGDYQRRQRERAAQVLSAAQLEVFTQWQKNSLEEARALWELIRQRNEAYLKNRQQSGTAP